MSRFINKSFALVALVGALTLFSTTKSEAAYLTGTIGYVGVASSTDSDANLALATKINIPLALSTGGTDSFAPIVALTPLTHVNPLVFSPFPGAGIVPLWSALGISFDLLTLNIDTANATTLVLSGTGIFHKA